MNKTKTTPWMICAILLCLCMTSIVFAQGSMLLNYQGRLTDGTGNPITGSDIQMTFTIYDGGGVAQWTSGRQSVQVEDGLFNYNLGSHVEIPDSVFQKPVLYLGIQIGSDPELSPRTELTSAPKAAVAYHLAGGNVETSEGLLKVQNISGAEEISIGSLARGNIGINFKSTGADPRDLISITAGTDFENRIDLFYPGASAEAGILQLGAASDLGGFISIHNAEPLLGEGIRLSGSAANANAITMFGGGHGLEYKLLEMTSQTGEGAKLSFFDPENIDGREVLAMSSTPGTGASMVMFNPQPEPPGFVGIEMTTNTARGPGGNISVFNKDSVRTSLSGGILEIGRLESETSPRGALASNEAAASLTLTGDGALGAPPQIALVAGREGASLCVGTDTPNEALTVMGNGWFSGEVFALTMTKVKKNIRPIDGALDKVGALNGYYYDCRADEFPELRLPETHQIGFLAEEVRAAVPEVVQVNKQGLDGVSYSRLTALLVEAVKELKAENEELKSRIEALESR